MTIEQELALKLESIRDSITGFKFATEALEDRADKMEVELADCRSKISILSNGAIGVEHQLSTNNKAMEIMSNDIRNVRNSVLSAILTAVILSVAGAASSTFYRSTMASPVRSIALPANTLAAEGMLA